MLFLVQSQQFCSLFSSTCVILYGESYELSLAPTPIAVYGNTMRHGAMDIFWYSIET